MLLCLEGGDESRLIVEELQRLGASVEHTRSAEATRARLDAIDAADPLLDAILVDMEMADLGAHSALRELRARGFAGSLIGLTPSAVREVRAHCIAAGCSDVTTRPVDCTDLVTRIAWHLERK
jgi:CheY-like chemotaxis protein